MIKKKLIINDIIVILIIVLISIFFAFSFNKNDDINSSEYITIMIGNDIYGEFNLNNDASIEIADTGVVCTIDNGKASIIHSDCPDKSCMYLPDITKSSASGTSIVCLPNLVSIIKNSSNNDSKGVDVIAS